MTQTFIPDGNGYMVNTVTVRHLPSHRTYPPFTCHCTEEEQTQFAAVEE